LDAWIRFPQHSVAPFKATKIYNSNAFVTFVTKFSNVDGTEFKISDVPEGIVDGLFSFAREGIFFKSDKFDKRLVINSVDDLMQILADSKLATTHLLVQEDGKYKEKLVALMGEKPESLRIFQIEADESPKLVETTAIISEPLKTRLPVNIEQLAQLRVGIVGLGSVGSKIAISLARSGLRQFVVVDDDYLMPGNIVRHELSWLYVGTHKVDALGEELRLIAPDIQVTKKAMRIAGQESATTAASALKELSSCNLIIDATANPQAFLLLAAVAKQYKISLCWGEIFAGGYGGLIARARPTLDPNPIAVRDAVYAYMATLPDAPYQNVNTYDVPHEEPLIAHDSDVAFVATSLTRLVLDTLTNQTSSEFPNSVYLIGMRKEWIFEAPFDIRPIDVRGDGWDRPLQETNDETRRDAFVMLLELCKNTKNDNADPS
jgi:molybdopterin/thiamine biosynthesis adenylyltransferase